MQESYLDAIRLDGDEAGPVSVSQSLKAVLCLHGPNRGVESSEQNGGGGVTEGQQAQKSNNKSEGHSRALGVVNCVSHCVWSFGRRFENGFVLLELWRERRLRNLLWDDGRGGTRRGAAEELAGGAAEKIHEHAEDEDH